MKIRDERFTNIVKMKDLENGSVFQTSYIFGSPPETYNSFDIYMKIPTLICVVPSSTTPRNAVNLTNGELIFINPETEVQHLDNAGLLIPSNCIRYED